MLKDEFYYNPKLSLFFKSPCMKFEGEGGESGGDDGGGGDGGESAPVALVNADGSFSEDWKESLGEDIRGEKMLDNLGDFHGMVKQFVHAQKNIGKGKVVLPDETSNENDWNAFYDAAGRPKTPDDYSFEKEKGLEEYYSDDLLKTFREGAHKVGINAKQMAFLNQFENARIKVGLEGMQAQAEAAKTEADDAVKALWGAAYPQMMHLANLFVNENTEEGEDRNSILKVVGNNSVIANLFAKASKKYIAEHKSIIGEMQIPAPADAKAKIAELQGTKGYISGELAQSNPGKHERIKKEIADLFKLAYPG